MEKYDIRSNLKNPKGVACLCNQYYVADKDNHRVVSINPISHLETELCKNQKCLNKRPMKPYSIVASSPWQKRIYYTDVINCCIQQINHPGSRETVIETMTYQNKLKKMGPHKGIALDSTGNVFASDLGQLKINALDISGHMRVDYNICHFEGLLSSPANIAFNSKDDLYVTDASKGLKIFRKENDTYRHLAVFDFKNVRSRRWRLRGIAIDKYDNVFIIARSYWSVGITTTEALIVLDKNHKYIAFNKAGFFGSRYARGLCFDYKRNRIIVADSHKNRLRMHKLYKDDTT